MLTRESRTVIDNSIHHSSIVYASLTSDISSIVYASLTSDLTPAAAIALLHQHRNESLNHMFQKNMIQFWHPSMEDRNVVQDKDDNFAVHVSHDVTDSLDTRT